MTTPEDQELQERLLRAQAAYGPPASAAESLGVITEEYYELIEAVRSNKRESVRWEALDLAAACLRLADACLFKTDHPFCIRSSFRSNPHAKP